MDRIPDAALHEKRRDSTVGCHRFLGFSRFNFDFGRCINPSRERPYFFQGRSMAGAMITFALLHVYGLQRPKWQRRLVANQRRGAPRHRLQNPKSGKRTHQGFPSRMFLPRRHLTSDF